MKLVLKITAAIVLAVVILDVAVETLNYVAYQQELARIRSCRERQASGDTSIEFLMTCGMTGRLR